MEIIIQNKIRLRNYPKKLKEFLINTLHVENPKYHEAIKHGRSTRGIKPYIVNCTFLPDNSLVIPRGLRKQILDENFLQSFSVTKNDFEVIDKRALFDYTEVGKTQIVYRPFQREAILKMITSSEEGLLVAPAGAGKTVMGLSIFAALGQPTLWLTHTNALATQTVERITQFIPGVTVSDIGFLGGGQWNLGSKIDIGLIPTLVRSETRLAELFGRYGLVILDEAHHCPATTFTKVISALNPFYLYGLTATPYRRDRLEDLMFQTIGPELARINQSDIEASGGIILPKVKFRPIYRPILQTNDIHEILTKLIHHQERNSIIVGDILREALSGNFCIVLTDRKAHAEILFNMIQIGWPKTGIATGRYNRQYVNEQVKKLNNSEITVLVCTFALLGEGFDVPLLNRAFLTLPFRAEGKLEQLVGRIQRTAEGKKDAIVYDYVDVNIGVVSNQFFTQSKNDCRYRVYHRLGLSVEKLE